MSRPLRILVLAAMLGVTAFDLAACGKRGPLEPPAGKPSTYPRTYPAS